MKVLGIVCSARKGGNTEILVKEALSGAKDRGASAELLLIGDKNIRPCDGCLSCEKTGVCRIKDDMKLVYEGLLKADGIIIGTPVYYWSVSGQAKMMIDRTIALTYPYLRLANKVAGAIAVAGRQGTVNALNLFQRYFAYNHMFTVDFVGGLASGKGTIVKDERGMKSAYEMGRQIVSLSKLKPTFPEEFNVTMYRYVQKKYRTPLYPVA